MQNTSLIVHGSIGAIAKQEGKSIAETFINVDCIILVDTSGSMEARDSRGGKSRYEVACEELKSLQETYPGKIAVLAFSDDVQFCPGGIPLYFGGNTNMAKALQFSKVADVPGMQFILISDGEPDNATETLKIASTYKNKISTIYVGPESSSGGRNFLTRLSSLTGGQSIVVDRAKELKNGVERLMLASG